MSIDMASHWQVNEGAFSPPTKANVEDAEAADIFFREGWASWRAAWGDDAMRALSRLGLVMVKPDGVAAGKVELLNAFLHEQGFRIISVRQVMLDRTMVRSLWHQDWLVYSVDRLDFSDYLYTAGPAVLLLIADGSEGAITCSHRLATLKGPALVEKRRPGQMRTELGSPNRVINYVHTPDSPLEMVSELSVFLNTRERADFLTAHESPDVAAQLQAVSNAPRHTFGLDSALKALGVEGTIGAAIDAGRQVPFAEVLTTVSSARADFDPWDLVTVALHAIELDYPPDRTATAASYQNACAAVGISVPTEYEVGARQALADIDGVRALLDGADVYDEPAGLYLPVNPSAT